MKTRGPKPPRHADLPQFDGTAATATSQAPAVSHGPGHDPQHGPQELVQSADCALTPSPDSSVARVRAEPKASTNRIRFMFNLL